MNLLSGYLGVKSETLVYIRPGKFIVNFGRIGSGEKMKTSVAVMRSLATVAIVAFTIWTVAGRLHLFTDMFVIAVMFYSSGPTFLLLQQNLITVQQKWTHIEWIN